ncbi:MAG: hypothetical protein VW405_08285, partial [Rhodospirillaceae bacterium]
GEVVIETSETDITVPLASLDADGETFPCGGMDIRLMVTRLPAELTKRTYMETHRLPLVVGKEARHYVRVTQEDGHIAWSSPIYISRE